MGVELWPLMAPLSIHGMSNEHGARVEWSLTGENRSVLTCLPACHFVVSTVSATWTAVDGMPAVTACAVTWPASVGVLIKG